MILSPKADLFLQITGKTEYSFTDTEGEYSYHCYNHNAFLTMMDGALSGKTGFTGNAGYCYVGALERNGKRYIVSLLACGWPNNRTYKWADTRKLMEYGIANFKKVSLDAFEPESDMQKSIPVYDAQTDRIREEKSIPLQLKKKDGISSILLGEGEEIRTEYRIAERLTAPVEKGSCVGAVYLKLGNDVLREYQVLVGESVKKRDITWCIGQILMAAF